MRTFRASIKNEYFDLHPLGAIYWESQQVLLFSDVHLGKSAHFRKNGIPAPKEADDKEYDKMDALLDHYQPKHLYFLGDLFHSHKNSSWEQFAHWVSQCATPMTLITGNHDVMGLEAFHQLGISTIEQRHIGGFTLQHDPSTATEGFFIAGHIHPGVLLHGKGKQRIKLPCFHETAQGITLPAFGDFTGLYMIDPAPGEKIYVIASQEVHLFT